MSVWTATEPDTYPYHYRDDGRWCPFSGVTRTRQAPCPNGCEGARHHYANDGHPQCDDDDTAPTVTAPTAIEQLRADLRCTACHGCGCDDCDYTGQQLCEHRTGPAEHCEQPRPCPTHDRHLIEEATL